MSKYVPGVPNGANITIAELLEMRSGLYNYTDAPEIAASMDRDPTKVWTPQELLAIAFARPPNFPPGTAYEYNNTNYVLLGLIAEQVDRQASGHGHARPHCPVVLGRLYFHGGETPGYNSFMGYDRTNQVTLVVWTNLTVSLDGSPTANALMRRCSIRSTWCRRCRLPHRRPPVSAVSGAIRLDGS